MNTFTIKLDDGTRIEWELKRVQRPSRLEVLKVLKVLEGKYVETLKEALVSGADNEEASRLVPFVLEENKGKNSKPVKYALWVLACYWYFHGGGPKPAAPKARRKKVQEKKYWVNDDLKCPVCGVFWTPEKVYTDKGSALPDFAKWLSAHAKKCGKPQQSKKTVKKEPEVKNEQQG